MRLLAVAIATALVLVGVVALVTAPKDCKVTVEADSASVLSTVNSYRVANGRSPLQSDDALTASAQWMAEDMDRYEYFSHTDSLGRDPFQRMAAFGYPTAWMGENLARDADTAQAVLDAWVASPGHNAILLATEATEAGVGIAGQYVALDVGGAVYVEIPVPTPVPTVEPTPEPAPVETPCS